MAIEYTFVRRPRRRTLAITIDRHNEVRVLAPSFVSKQAADAFVAQKRSWIERKRRENELRVTVLDPQFTQGETFYYLGMPYQLTFDNHRPTGISNHQLILNLADLGADKRKIRQHMVNWYKERATDVIMDRVLVYQNSVSRRPVQVRVKTLKSRWGSCSSSGNLSFAWSLIMAPIPVIDYVVVHELCHLDHFDHSPAFWAKVEQIYPDFRVARQWLKKQPYPMGF